MKKDCMISKKDKNNGNVANVVTNEIQDVLLLFVDSPPIDSCILDSGASFRTAIYYEIMKKFVVGELWEGI